MILRSWHPRRTVRNAPSTGRLPQLIPLRGTDEERAGWGETKMKSGEKKAREQSKEVKVPVFRVPASLAEAYELGWQWQRESFKGLREDGTTKEGVVRREGLAYFVSERETDGIAIPFVATYEFGAPRQPKYPSYRGSVFLLDEEPESETDEPKNEK
jgi:hypothetical protein